METHTELDVEEAWEVIVSHLLGTRNTDLMGNVRDSLKKRASQISAVLKLDMPLEQKRTAIDSFEMNAANNKRKHSSNDLNGRETTDITSSIPSCSWCFCSRCRMMPSDEEELCCTKEEGKDCFSQGEMMKVIIAGGRLIKTCLNWTMPRQQLHRLLRRGLYKQLSVWRYSHLGPNVRKALPSCCVWTIRDTFPDPYGLYQGFRARDSVTGDLNGRETTDITSSIPSCSWCFCSRCSMMPSDEEEICCTKEEGEDCLSQGEMMKVIIAGGRSLKTSLKSTMPRQQLHRLLRRGLYKQLSVWLYSHLGPKIRKPLPSCCVWTIRDTFPDPYDLYLGFRPSSSILDVTTESKN